MPGLTISFLGSNITLVNCRSTLVSCRSNDLVQCDIRNKTGKLLKWNWNEENSWKYSWNQQHNKTWRDRMSAFGESDGIEGAFVQPYKNIPGILSLWVMKKPNHNSFYCFISSFLFYFHSYTEPYLNEWCSFLVKNGVQERNTRYVQQNIQILESKQT